MTDIIWILKVFGWSAGIKFVWYSFCIKLSRIFGKKRIPLHPNLTYSLSLEEIDQLMSAIDQDQKEEAYQKIGITLH